MGQYYYCCSFLFIFIFRMSCYKFMIFWIRLLIVLSMYRFLCIIVSFFVMKFFLALLCLGLYIKHLLLHHFFHPLQTGGKSLIQNLTSIFRIKCYIWKVVCDILNIKINRKLPNTVVIVPIIDADGNLLSSSMMVQQYHHW
jgi:hypothetical protein